MSAFDAMRALLEAADEIERELICCPDDGINPNHEICRWAIAARNIVVRRAEGLSA